MDKLLKNKSFYVPSILFILFTLVFGLIHSKDLIETENSRQLWADFYQVIAIYGGIVGVFISNKWGGFKSLLGKVIMCFSIGLFFQAFGQSAYSIYPHFFQIAVPYPSIGDLGFFGSIIWYIMGVYYLAKVMGAQFSFKSLAGKLQVVLIPIVMLLVSYFFFLQGYEFDWSNKLTIFLDFGYPFGQAIYVSIALIAFMASRNVLGGIMKKPIMFLIFALVFQYLSDFMFLYQASNETWYVGGLNDYMYMTSYFLMTTGLIYMGSVFKQIKES